MKIIHATTIVVLICVKKLSTLFLGGDVCYHPLSHNWLRYEKHGMQSCSQKQQFYYAPSIKAVCLPAVALSMVVTFLGVEMMRPRPRLQPPTPHAVMRQNLDQS